MKLLSFTLQDLEKYQVILFAAAIGFGVLTGITAPERTNLLEFLFWPTLGALLYATFTQFHLYRLKEALADVRFLAAAVSGNFLVVKQKKNLFMTSSSIAAFKSIATGRHLRGGHGA